MMQSLVALAFLTFCQVLLLVGSWGVLNKRDRVSFVCFVFAVWAVVLNFAAETVMEGGAG